MEIDLNKFYELGTLTKPQVDENWDALIAAFAALGNVATVDAAGAQAIREGISGEVITVLPMYQANAPVESSGSGGWDINFRDGLVFKRTMTGNTTLNAPTQGNIGKVGLIHFIQDATGGRTLAFSTAYNHVGGAPSISLTPDAVNVFSYFIESWDAVDGWSVDLCYLGVRA